MYATDTYLVMCVLMTIGRLLGPLFDKGPTRGSMVCEKVQSVGPLLDKGPTRGSMVCEKVQSVGPLLDKGPTRGSMV